MKPSVSAFIPNGVGLYGYETTCSVPSTPVTTYAVKLTTVSSSPPKTTTTFFEIVRRQRAKGLWDDDTATQLAVGLKLLSKVVLLNRRDPLFAPLQPALGEFIGRLKTLPEAPSTTEGKDA